MSAVPWIIERYAPAVLVQTTFSGGIRLLVVDGAGERRIERIERGGAVERGQILRKAERCPLHRESAARVSSRKGSYRVRSGESPA